MATQPIPPSDMAIFSSGKRAGQPLQSHSEQAVMATWAKSVPPSSIIGAPGGMSGKPDEPTWRFSTVPVSEQARMIGSQYSSKTGGSP